ncbi:SIS domain-containing protein [Clostridium sp. DMHC 10]|uniref:SIS domain-containing protein n=1 Tax=Clostridium sp. DMHC 10 TaxID=747377 RepID=UPI000AB4E77A|nr:SIS domain-containing protein [Clostridium sp. DMHC 10]
MDYSSKDIKNIISEILEKKKAKGGVKSIYFVGCGGSLGALYPAKTFMEKECTSIRSAWISSNEFVHSTPKDFGENSIICLACHKGNTPETIAAAKLGKEMGAAVIILTWLKESEIIEFGDYIIRYTFDASPDHLKGDIDYSGEKTICALLVAVELLAQTEGYGNYDKFYEGIGMISNIIKKCS